VNDKDTILAHAIKLLTTTDPAGKKIRLLGISVSNFVPIAIGIKTKDEIPNPNGRNNTPWQLELF
jgi:hypothetical protein